MTGKLFPALIFLLVGIVVGTLVMVQSRIVPTRVVNPVSPFTTLVDLRTQLISRQLELKSSITGERQKQSNLSKQLVQRTVDRKHLEEIELLKVLVGLQPMKGQGVVITLDDAKKGQPTTENIVHAADLRDVVNVLWLSGATAISVNQQRLVPGSSINSVVNTVLVNDTKVANPFVIKAIGPVAQLHAVVSNHDHLVGLNRRAKTLGLTYHSERSSDLEVESFEGSLAVTVANPTDE